MEDNSADDEDDDQTYERLDLPGPQGDPRPLELPDRQPRTEPKRKRRGGVAATLFRAREEIDEEEVESEEDDAT